mgnify:CR=1 FL=1
MTNIAKDPVQTLLAFSELPAGNFDPFNAQAPQQPDVPSDFYPIQILPDTLKLLLEATDRVNEAGEYSATPWQVVASLLAEAVVELIEDTACTE